MLSSSLHEAAFNASPICHCLVSPTDEATILAVNDAFLQASGQRREALLGMRLSETRLKTAPSLARAVANVIATETADALEIGHDRRFWHVVLTPVFGHGELLCVALAASDITEQVRFRALSSATADVIYRMSPDWTQMWELEGRGVLEDTSQAHRHWLDAYVPADERGRVNAAIALAIQSKSVFELEHRVCLKDGAFGRVASRAVPMLDADGEIYEWIGAASDITGQTGAEEKYRTLFNSIDEGFCIIELLYDANGRPNDYRFCELNPSFATHTGLQDAIGKTVRQMNPSHEQHWFDSYHEVLRSGQPMRFEDGSDSLDRYFDVYAFRIEDQGQPRIAVLFKDISAQKRAYRQARESEARAIEAAAQAEEARRGMEALLHAAPVGIVLSDSKGGIMLTNAEHDRLWGGRPPKPSSVAEFTEWKGWWADESARHGKRLRAEDWTTAHALLGEFVRSNTVEIESFGELPVRHTILVSGAPVRDAANQVIGAVTVQMDITDRVKAEQALRDADRKKDEFLAMLAHELRNPLAPISAAAALLTMAELPPAVVRKTSAVIARQAKHMAELVDDLLDVSRVTRGLVTLKMERLDVKQIVSEAMEQVRPLLAARAHHAVVHALPQPACVMGDHKRLVQVVSNVLTNAAKYTPAGGNIAVAIAVEGGNVTIQVTDDGIGIEPALIAQVFELFTQAQRTADRSQGGLGIGLALVKSLVELQGGRVAAHSDGLAQGSRFTIALPSAPERPAARAASPEPSPRGANAKLTVLIVDDNQDAAQMLAMYLAALGHTVSVEHRAHDAFARAIADRPQVCLLDIGLPDMDGNELARNMKKHNDTKDAVLIAVSGYGQEQDRAVARDAGFSHYFVKPVHAEQLANFLSELSDKLIRKLPE